MEPPVPRSPHAVGSPERASALAKFEAAQVRHCAIVTETRNLNYKDMRWTAADDVTFVRSSAGDECTECHKGKGYPLAFDSVDFKTTTRSNALNVQLRVNIRPWSPELSQEDIFVRSRGD